MTKYADGAAPRRTDRVDRVDPSRPPEGNCMVDEPKNKMSRRKFLHGAAMGAATVGALAAAPSVLGLTENASAGTMPSDPGTPVMAYVADAATGTVVVMWGTKEIVTKDSRLASRILGYAQG